MPNRVKRKSKRKFWIETIAHIGEPIHCVMSNMPEYPMIVGLDRLDINTIQSDIVDYFNKNQNYDIKYYYNNYKQETEIYLSNFLEEIGMTRDEYVKTLRRK